MHLRQGRKREACKRQRDFLLMKFTVSTAISTSTEVLSAELWLSTALQQQLPSEGPGCKPYSKTLLHPSGKEGTCLQASLIPSEQAMQATEQIEAWEFPWILSLKQRDVCKCISIALQYQDANQHWGLCSEMGKPSLQSQCWYQKGQVLHVWQGDNTSVPVIINESVVAKGRRTIWDVLRPNSVPTDNTRDQIIQLTSVAFGLDLRLCSEWD